MISFLQNLLQKHYKWLFSLLLGVIIISFVFTIGAPGISRGEKREKREFYGFDLNSQRDMDALIRGSYLSALFATGQPPYNKQFMQEEALARAFLLHLVSLIGLPLPKEQQLTDFIKTRPFFADEEGDFDPENYKKFLDSLKENPYMSSAFVREILMDDYRIERLKKIMEGPGFVLPAEAKMYVSNLHTSFNLSVVEMDFEKFNPTIEVTDKNINAFLDSNQKQYEEQPGVLASYVTFNYSAFKPTGSSEKELQDFYDKNKNLFKEGDKVAEFLTVKDRVKNEWAKSKSKQLAGKAASDFTLHLYDKNIKFKSQAFADLIKKNHLEIKVLSKYSRTEMPKNTNLPNELLSQAFLLNENQYFSDPVNTADGVVVLFFEKLFPAYVPPMAAIREKITADYKASEKARLFNEEGKFIKDRLVKAVSQGKTFADAAKELNLSIKEYKDISYLNKKADVDPSVFGLLSKLHQGDVSPMVPSKKGGLLVYVSHKKVSAISESSEDFQKTTQSLKNFVSMFSTRGILMEMAERELEKGLKSSEKKSVL